MSVHKYKTSEDAAKNLAEEINKQLKSLKHKNLPVLLMLSGGSALTILEYLNIDYFSSYITLTMVDERYDITNINNNYHQLMKLPFYKKVKEKKIKEIPTIVNSSVSLEKQTLEYENSIIEWINNNKKGKIIVILGMGIDGHIAGIMPFPNNSLLFQELFLKERLAIHYDAGDKNKFKKRFTSTFSLLKKADQIFAYICGDNKKTVFLSARNNKNLPKIPASFLFNFKKSDIFTNIL